jgi:hypothetical protein
MTKYAIIPIDQYDEETLNGVIYPVNINYGEFQMLEYNDQPNPTNENWVIFSGEDANVKCAEYLEETNE